MEPLRSDGISSCPSGYELEVFERGEARSVRLPIGVTLLGRGRTADIPVEDAGVSRRHVRFRVGEGVEVEDMGSVNGTGVLKAELQSLDDDATSKQLGQLAPGTPVVLDVGDIVHAGSVVITLRRAADSPVPSAGPVLADPEMRKIHGLLERAAQTEISVLILGETGAGKELMAEVVHRGSARADKPFLKLNCAALSDSLLESELFGHERGAFTGAHAAKEGLFEATNGGTVFLDEIGELPMGMQAKLLRVLEERTVIRVGSNKERPVDVRFVAATNRELKREAKRGNFRPDLYYRVSGLAVTIPPLRDRPADIEPLAHHFLASAAGESPVPRLSAKALEMMLAHSWPGNVRELKNVIDRAALFTTGDTVHPEHVQLESVSEFPAVGSRIRQTDRPMHGWRAAPQAAPPPRDDERARVVHALESCGGNQTRAAEMLGMSRRTLVNRLNEFDLPRPKKRSAVKTRS